MSINSKTKTTSVKIIQDLYESFKRLNIGDDMNLQRLINRSIFLYMEDEEFREKLEDAIDLKVSGSSF
jgi:hypothetical protein